MSEPKTIRNILADLAASVQSLPLLPTPYVAIVAGRCGECKNWKSGEGEHGFGICRAIGWGSSVARILTNAYGKKVEFATTADFGCVLWESKVDVSS